MAVPLVGAAVSSVANSFWFKAGVGLLIGSFVGFSDKILKNEKTPIQQKVEDTPPPQVPNNSEPSLISLMAERNHLLHSQNQLLSLLIDVAKAGALGSFLGSLGGSFPVEYDKAFSKSNLSKNPDKAKDKNKGGFKPNISAGDTIVKDVPKDLTKPDVKPSVDNVALASIATAVDNLGKAQLANNELISAMNATAINNSQRVANAITSGKMTAEVKNNVKVQNDVVIRRLEAELSVNKPVEVSLPAEVMAYNKSMLEQKTKEVENSTKTYEIYKEQDTYQKTAQNIADLDGKTITNATPRDVALQYQATRARTATDVNSFELDDTDIDTLFGNFPDITKIFNFTLPSEIDKEFSS